MIQCLHLIQSKASELSEAWVTLVNSNDAVVIFSHQNIELASISQSLEHDTALYILETDSNSSITQDRYSTIDYHRLVELCCSSHNTITW